ncbi:MAG: hypothetical protein Q8L40_08850 [Burkholderiales bacterium]|nr:hypothetical protein [Burkholderiales bacterium]
MLMSGCAQIRPYVPPSEGHISAPQAKSEPESAIPPPARISNFVPPPKPAIKPQTYSVVVNEVPVKELLLALARDTKQNIDIHAGLDGKVSLNAIDETLPAILNRISKQVNLRYQTEGNTILVSPDTPYMKTYIVNYVNIQRETLSSSGAAGQVDNAGGNTSSTKVTTKSNSDFWGLLKEAVVAILKSSLQHRQKVEAIAESIIKKQEETRARQMEASSRSASPAGGAPVPPAGGAAGGTSVTPPPLKVELEDVIVNPVAGTITINGDEKQHQMVQEYLTMVENGAQRQVLIEATIVEVRLSDAYQGGVDWSRLGSQFTISQALLGGFSAAATAAGAAASSALTIGVQRPSSGRIGDITATIKLLQEFGDTRVLSSPKLMALNNQTALLKAVNDVVYFEVKSTPATLNGTNLVPGTTTTTAKSVSVGIVMGVTPQINEDGRVTLIVRPTISSLIGLGKQDPNPSLVIPNIVPEIQTREMESVLQVSNGQTIIMGGLMQDSVQRNREQIPGADKLAAAGEAFRYRDERATKSELVIFLRPTVIKNPSLESEELKFFQRFLPQPEQSPEVKAGAAR